MLFAQTSTLTVSPQATAMLLGTAALMMVLAVVGKVPIGYSLRNLRVR